MATAGTLPRRSDLTGTAVPGIERACPNAFHARLVPHVTRLQQRGAGLRTLETADFGDKVASVMKKSMAIRSKTFFLNVLQILAKPSATIRDLPDLQRQLVQELQSIEQQVGSGEAGISNAEWDLIKKGLVYWADEVLTRHIEDWEDFVLEHKYYGERMRAWKFYNTGEQAIASGSSDAAEIFYLAVALGFKGHIRDAFDDRLPGDRKDEEEARDYWAKKLQRQIRVEQSRDLHGEPLEGHVEPMYNQGMLRVSLTAFMISALILFILVGWWMSE